MNALKKFWNFIWKSDTPASWIVSILLAFILVKFIVYPGIGFLMGTTHPIVAVVSWSMEHEGGFDNWWETHGDWYEQNGISLEDFKKFKLKNGFNQGDIMFVLGKQSQDINIGDVLIFKSTTNYPVIHRIVDKWEQDGEIFFKTKGDNNSDSFAQLNEKEISSDRVVGVATLRVPYLGWIKILFNKVVGGFV